MTWRISDGPPAHVGLQRYLRWDEAIAEINSKSLKVRDSQFTSQEATEGLLEELADEFVAYAENTPFHKGLRDFLTGRTPWLDV